MFFVVSFLDTITQGSDFQIFLKCPWTCTEDVGIGQSFLFQVEFRTF